MQGHLMGPHSLLRQIYRTVLLVISMAASVPCAMAAAVTEDVWLMDAKVAVKIFPCGDRLCGRIVWLVVPRDPQGNLNRDKNNPDILLRQRRLCGLTILWGLKSTAPDRWEGGRLYNPFDGETYNFSAKLKSGNKIVARIYRGLPLLGKTKTLQRVAHGTLEGWC